MMDPTRWAGLTVESFFQGYNWSGTSPKLAPTVTEVEANLPVPSWLCLSVQDFLHQANWRGIPLESAVPGDRGADANAVALDETPLLQLTVQDFFGRGNWRGKAVSPSARSSTKKTTNFPSANTEDIGLTDLSALF